MESQDSASLDDMPVSPAALDSPMIGPENVPWHGVDVFIAALPILVPVILGWVGSSFLPTPTPVRPRTYPPDWAIVLAAYAGSLVLFGGWLLVIRARTVRRYPIRWTALGFRPAPMRFFLIAVAVGIGLSIITTFVNTVGRLLLHRPTPTTTLGSNATLLIGLIGLLAIPVFELFLRGMLFGWLRMRMDLLPAAVLSALCELLIGYPDCG